MNKQDIIIWDTTQFGDYPENIKKIYFKCSISNRKSFSSWIGTNSIFKDLDWWSTAAASKALCFKFISPDLHHRNIKKISKFGQILKLLLTHLN